MATEPTPPAERAQEIIQSVPSTSLVTKTGAVVLGTALTATAISQELYVANDETVVLAGFLVFAAYLGRVNRRRKFMGILLIVFSISLGAPGTLQGLGAGAYRREGFLTMVERLTL